MTWKSFWEIVKVALCIYCFYKAFSTWPRDPMWFVLFVWIGMALRIDWLTERVEKLEKPK